MSDESDIFFVGAGVGIMMTLIITSLLFVTAIGTYYEYTWILGEVYNSLVPLEAM